MSVVIDRREKAKLGSRELDPTSGGSSTPIKDSRVLLLAWSWEVLLACPDIAYFDAFLIDRLLDQDKCLTPKEMQSSLYIVMMV